MARTNVNEYATPDGEVVRTWTVRSPGGITSAVFVVGGTMQSALQVATHYPAAHLQAVIAAALEADAWMRERQAQADAAAVTLFDRTEDAAS